MPLSQRKYTYEDYLKWPPEFSCELLHGQVYTLHGHGQVYGMSPAPGVRHQEIVLNIGSQLKAILKDKKCRPFISPVDVVLAKDTVVQPDVLIVCDSSKIGEKHIEGAPDVVFEVLSPATARKDKYGKKAVYEQYGVKEYILIDPLYDCVEQFQLAEKTLPSTVLWLEEDAILKIATVPLEIPLREIFYPQEPKKPIEKPPTPTA